jgi:hypothetical protein
MKKITLLITFLMTIIAFNANAQFGCATGVSISDGYTASGITTPGTGGAEDWNSPNPTSSCSSNASYWDDDVYMFTYTAGGTDEEISMTTFTRNSWNGLGIFTTCSGTALDDCIDSDSSSSSSNSLTVTASITAGQTVYIATGQWGAPNDLDFDVTAFTVTQLVNPPNCDSTVDAGLVSPNSGTLSWTAATGNPTGYFISVGSGTGLSDILANTDVGNVTSYDVSGLSEATTYYTTITPYNGNGNATGCTEQTFTTSTPPANDDCGGAIPLTVNSDLNCGTTTAGTTNLASASSQTDDVTGTPNTDVWYSFIATAADHSVVLSNVVNQGGGTSTSTDMGMGVYDATGGCAGLVFFDDSDPDMLNLTGLTVSTTYYVRVYGWYSTIQYNNFDICVGTTPPPPPAPTNDDCANATLVDGALPYNNTQDATSATNNGGFLSVCASMNDGVWYTFTPITGGTVDIAITGVTGWDPEIAIYSGSCGTFVCEDSADGGGTGGDENLTSVAVVAGTQYFINIGHYSGSTDNSEGPFTIDISTQDTVGLSVEDNVIQGFSLYPNPVNDRLHLNALDNIEELSVYNLLGQEVLRTQPKVSNTEVDMSNLPTGMYVVKVKVGEQLGSYRIVKK